MKLWDNAASPYAFKVRATLYEKGIECEKAELRYHSQRAELLRFNPRGEVPALVDGATVVYDSRVICDYLEETHPAPPLLPRSPPHARAVGPSRRSPTRSSTPASTCSGS
jgi:glutathione S-transferase